MISKRKVQKVRLYSYSKIWNVRSKLYALGNFVLPVPIDWVQLLYFVLAIFIVGIITSIIPFLSQMTVVIRFGILPYLVSQFLLRKKLDGKNPIKYFIGVLFYVLEKGNFLDRFSEHTEKEGDIKIFWNCSQRKGSHNV